MYIKKTKVQLYCSPRKCAFTNNPLNWQGQIITASDSLNTCVQFSSDNSISNNKIVVGHFQYV